MTLKTDLRGLSRIDDGSSGARLNMQASRSVTRFAADVLRIIAPGHQTCVRRCLEITRNVLMTIRTSRRTHISCPCNLWWNDLGALQRSTGNKRSPRCYDQQNEENFPLTTHCNASTKRPCHNHPTNPLFCGQLPLVVCGKEGNWMGRLLTLGTAQVKSFAEGRVFGM